MPRNTVPAHGAIRRVRALQAIGWSITNLSHKSGKNANYFEFIYYPTRRIPLRQHVEIVQLYNRLRWTYGPSDHSVTVGKRRGWAPPWVWSDIDDPNETIQFLS